MIYKLRKKMLVICCSSVIGVFSLIFVLIAMFTIRRINASMDMVTDRISEGNGVFLPFDQNNPLPPGGEQIPGFFNEESPFSTRFFTVWIDKDGAIVGENIDSISSVTQEQAHTYAKKALNSGKERGWCAHFRYKIFDTDRGQGIVFVDSSTSQFLSRTIILIAGLVLLISMAVIVVLIVFLSKQAVRPIAQSYEKQKQFVTDANHELKTPLTLILTNLDIVESEYGHSEWIDDIRVEGQRMGSLISQLTALSRLDEDQIQMSVSEFSVSDLCCDTLSEFAPMVESEGFDLTFEIQPNVRCFGDEGAIRQLVAILLDNAVKYCDPAGSISVSLSSNRQTAIVVENTFCNVDQIELDRLFDRFYRADKARTAGSGFGIGLSLAQSIAGRHNGDICAYKAGPDKIGFKVILK